MQREVSKGQKTGEIGEEQEKISEKRDEKERQGEDLQKQEINRKNGEVGSNQDRWEGKWERHLDKGTKMKENRRKTGNIDRSRRNGENDTRDRSRI